MVRRVHRPPKASVQYETNIIANADFFTTYQHGRDETWKATGIPTLEEAMDAARGWLSKSTNPRPVMIYAVKSGHQALVGTLQANGVWKEAIRK